jgi:DNA-binding transcriptional ArsR family regulator
LTSGVEPQRAQAGVPPQRASIQYFRQSSSVANRRSNSGAAFGKLRHQSSLSSAIVHHRADGYMPDNCGGDNGTGMKCLTRGAIATILNYMVMYQSSPLDATFAALADPTRRAMLARLADDRQLSASALAAPFAMSLPAALKHIGVLAQAGLVRREKVGRTVHCRLEAEPLRAAHQWIARYERFWSERLDALAAILEEDARCQTDAITSSSSSATSRRRSRKSTPPGRRRRR